ncbi:hypothetical protein EMIT0P44_290018 [Pseudomonas sp. IT-P44]
MDWLAAKPLFYGGWQCDGKFFSKWPKATCIRDDNYYEGSLGHTRRLPGPEAAVPNQRGIRHGFDSKHQHYVAERSEEPEPCFRRAFDFDDSPVFRPENQQRQRRRRRPANR